MIVRVLRDLRSRVVLERPTGFYAFCCARGAEGLTEGLAEGSSLAEGLTEGLAEGSSLAKGLAKGLAFTSLWPGLWPNLRKLAKTCEKGLAHGLFK